MAVSFIVNVLFMLFCYQFAQVLVKLDFTPNWFLSRMSYLKKLIIPAIYFFGIAKTIGIDFAAAIQELVKFFVKRWGSRGYG